MYVYVGVKGWGQNGVSPQGHLCGDALCPLSEASVGSGICVCTSLNVDALLCVCLHRRA